MEKISEKTLLPISLIATFIGGLWWLFSVGSDAAQAKKDVEELKSAYRLDNKEDQEFKIEVIDRLSRIETEIKKRGK